jgi:divalent metal cation (Fe/Co/Zn/Cd) transporter
MTFQPPVQKEHASARLARKGQQSALVGITINFVLAAGKITAGMFGHSFALVADGIESLSDVSSSFFVYLGLKLAVKPPDDKHTYGHGKP